RCDSRHYSFSYAGCWIRTIRGCHLEVRIHDYSEGVGFNGLSLYICKSGENTKKLWSHFIYHLGRHRPIPYFLIHDGLRISEKGCQVSQCACLLSILHHTVQWRVSPLLLVDIELSSYEGYAGYSRSIEY